MSSKIYKFPRNEAERIIQCKKLTKQIASRYGYTQNELVCDILDHAYESLPDDFSYQMFIEEVIAICEDLSYADTLND